MRRVLLTAAILAVGMGALVNTDHFLPPNAAPKIVDVQLMEDTAFYDDLGFKGGWFELTYQFNFSESAMSDECVMQRRWWHENYSDHSDYLNRIDVFWDDDPNFQYTEELVYRSGSSADGHYTKKIEWDADRDRFKLLRFSGMDDNECGLEIHAFTCSIINRSGNLHKVRFYDYRWEDNRQLSLPYVYMAVQQSDPGWGCWSEASNVYTIPLPGDTLVPAMPTFGTATLAGLLVVVCLWFARRRPPALVA